MLRKIFSGIVLALLLTSMLMLEFAILPASTSQQTPLLKTDKNKYKSGQTVTITLVNIGDKPVQINQDIPWIIYTHPDNELVYPKSPSYQNWWLEPGAEDSWVWHQFNEFESRPAEPSNYVIKDTQGWGLSVRFSIVTYFVVPDDYKTIQEAIDKSSDGGTVYVRSGTYREWIIINKPLRIEGESKENTTINGYGVPDCGRIVQILSSDVSLYNLNITHPDEDPHFGITIGSEMSSRLIGNITISGNSIYNCDEGIFVWRASDINITCNEFERCKPNGIHSPYSSGIRIRVINNTMHLEGEPPTNSAGIRVTGSKNSTFSGNKITNIHAGICTSGDNGSTYVHNELHQCSDGISISDGRGNLIGYNRMYENDLCISLDRSSNNNLTSNEIFENPEGTGIRIHNLGNNTVIRNTISNLYNCSQACTLEESQDSLIEGNVIQACSCGISTDDDSTDNIICNNDFLENDIYGNELPIYVSEAGTNCWENNYWSDYEGVDTDNNGCGVDPDKKICFNVNGQGYVNVTISKNLLDGSFKVLVNNSQIPHSVTWNSTSGPSFPSWSTSICFNHSTPSLNNVKIEAECKQIGDLDGDGKVGIIDISIVAQHFGEEFQRP